eukprot:TRINITY_DN102247_c0_g1_i1.p1 TRINITY_DN102247_c0_g1~~TRINITY_DN102247_c0_g1_i1.p1  ORF type:complete len:162 (+),score=32.35 TRINITY_DN102247_c0_g1_i1:37-486(+)
MGQSPHHCACPQQEHGDGQVDDIEMMGESHGARPKSSSPLKEVMINLDLTETVLVDCSDASSEQIVDDPLMSQPVSPAREESARKKVRALEEEDQNSGACIPIIADPEVRGGAAPSGRVANRKSTGFVSRDDLQKFLSTAAAAAADDDE